MSAQTAEAPRTSLEEDVVEACQVFGATMEKAAQAYQAATTTAAAVRAKIPEVVEALVVNGRIDGEDKEACARALEDPLKTLELLKFAAAHRTAGEGGQSLPATEVDANGRRQGGHTKAASGARRLIPVGAYQGEDHPANLAFDRALGLIS